MNETQLQAREDAALEELRGLGFKIGLYEPRSFVEEDPLRGIKGGWRVGVCRVIANSTAGKRKTISAMSAVHAVEQARSWLKHLENFPIAQRFVIVPEGRAVPVVHRQPSSSIKRAERHHLAFSEDGGAHRVDAQGAPIEN